jgi:hypothetical protein
MNYHFGGENMGSLVNISVFFAGLGIFFIGIGVLWGIKYMVKTEEREIT